MIVKRDGIALLTECELQVMKCIWDYDGDINLPVVLQLANERFNNNWKPQTVSTFVTRLRNKGFLSLEKIGRTYIYKAEVSKEIFLKVEATRFTDFWFDGNGKAASEYFKNLKI